MQAFGEIRSLYTACKSRGFVVLSFFDLRASCLAIHALQGAQLGGDNLQISFSTPKDNMGDKDAHQGMFGLPVSPICKRTLRVPLAIRDSPSLFWSAG